MTPAEACAAAVEAYRTSLGPEGQPAAVAYAAGRAWEVAGDHHAALDAWLSACDLYDGPLPQRLTASLLRGAAATDRAAAVARHLAASPFADRQAWAGVLQVTGGALEDGAATLSAALTGDLPDAVRITATEALTHALAATGRVDEALSACEDALDDHDLPALRAVLAALLIQDGRPDEALDHANAALVAAPELAAAHLAAGTALAWLGRRDEAAASLATAVRLAPDLAPQAAAVLG